MCLFFFYHLLQQLLGFRPSGVRRLGALNWSRGDWWGSCPENQRRMGRKLLSKMCLAFHDFIWICVFIMNVIYASIPQMTTNFSGLKQHKCIIWHFGGQKSKMDHRVVFLLEVLGENLFLCHFQLADATSFLGSRPLSSSARQKYSIFKFLLLSPHLLWLWPFVSLL